MKSLKYLSLTVLVLILLNTSYSQVTVVNNSNFSYKVESNTVLYINNTLGNINIVRGDANIIKVSVKASSTSRGKNRAIKRLGKIDIKEKIEGNNISVSTILADKRIKNNKYDVVDVTYTVTVPISLPLYLANKYGNIIIDEHHGKLNVNLMYGNFYAKNLIFSDSQPLPKLKFKYSDVEIDNCNWADINTTYTNLNIKKAKTLLLKTKYTKVKINELNLLRINSDNDKYQIKQIDKMYAEAKYSTIKINNISSDIKFKGSYGALYVDYVSSMFESVDVNFSYGKVRLNIDENTSYKTNCTVSYGKITKPARANISVHKSRTSETITGVIGVDKDTQKRVNIINAYGNIEF